MYLSEFNLAFKKKVYQINPTNPKIFLFEEKDVVSTLLNRLEKCISHPW